MARGKSFRAVVVQKCAAAAGMGNFRPPCWRPLNFRRRVLAQTGLAHCLSRCPLIGRSEVEVQSDANDPFRTWKRAPLGTRLPNVEICGRSKNLCTPGVMMAYGSLGQPVFLFGSRKQLVMTAAEQRDVSLVRQRISFFANMGVFI